jgi:hypothetical protein
MHTQEHINILELRAALLGFRASFKRGIRGRLCSFIDSTVVTGGISKGRFGSRTLNNVWRAFLPELIMFESYTAVFNLSSAASPSDAPSRGVPLWNWYPPQLPFSSISESVPEWCYPSFANKFLDKRYQFKF